MAKRSEKKYQFWSSQLLTVFFIKFHLVSDYGKGSFFSTFFSKVVVLPTSLPFINSLSITMLEKN